MTRWLLALLLLLPAVALASPQQAWQQAVATAAQGDVSRAAAMLEGAANALPEMDPWHQRMITASTLFTMQSHQTVSPDGKLIGNHGLMAQAWLQQHASPQPVSSWVVGIIATLLPGAGHLWLQRWRDALVVVALVWPLIGLTLWAGRRRMGPVTVFFAMITTWIWSGTVFSAISLAKRGGLEQYMVWWHALWQAAGLPGSP
ncbi:MAG: hypothetical protein R8J84_00805 [Mariprofundales bacterium]